MKTLEELRKEPKLEICQTGFDGGTGVIHINGLRKCTVIWSFSGRWEHVSICPANRTPYWEEMCQIKDMFWNGDECVIQYHPPKSNYVNLATNCLHLWRPTNVDLPMPPSDFV